MFRVNSLDGISGAEKTHSCEPVAQKLIKVDDARRRLERFGAVSLADEELLALVLGPGGGVPALDVALKICRHWPDLSRISVMPVAVLARQAGISPARARRLLAAIELGWRANLPQPAGGLAVQRPEDLHSLLRREFQGLDRERFLALYLDTRHSLRLVETVSIGTLNASLVHPREVFKNAIGISAAAVIVAHNHPSGCAQPSNDDLKLTARLDRCGEVLGISLLDHLVVGDVEIVSIRENGWPSRIME
jgi:DNA repair protein RadC